MSACPHALEERPMSEPTWFIAECQDCTPVLPQPFTDQAKRDEWVAAHRNGTGHRVELREEDHLHRPIGAQR